MLSQNFVIPAAFGYLLLLFAIAYYGDWRRARGRSIIANPYIYTLSLAVYCTSWTFFGSVGRAATQGLPFLTVYLGPTVMAFFWWFILRKMLRICKENNLTTMSDFLTLRYGKRPCLGILTTLGVLVAIVPYIGLQLKSVADTYNILVHQAVASPLHVPVFHDTAFYVALILAVFCVLFGARHLDPTERHEGMVAAVAFESVIKLLAFLAIGFLVTYGLFHGWGDIFDRIRLKEGCLGLLALNTGPNNSYLLVMVQILLSMGAIILLPRQFHMAVVENTDERHILTAMWLLPLYLFLINLFVMPIACGGLLLGLPAATGDTFVLQIPLQNGHPWLALVTFLGGLSASTAMVAVASVAVSTMLLNSLVMPGAIRLNLEKYLPIFLLNSKRITILAVILLGYLSYRVIGPSAMLVDMGLIAFCGVMQLAPAILGALYWRDATRSGAIAGLTSGFLLWAYTLICPYLINAGWFPSSILNAGPWGLSWLKPTAFLGLKGLDELSHAFFWSMFFNVGAFVGVSLLTNPSPEEEEQARRFIEVFKVGERPADKRFTFLPSLSQLTHFMGKFIGLKKAREASKAFLQEVGVPEQDWGDKEKLELANFVERTIAGSLGPATARVIVESYLAGLGSRMEDVFDLFSKVSSSLTESEEKLKRRAAELSVLYEAARRLASSLAIPDLLEGVLDLLVERLGIERCAVRLLGEDGLLRLKGYRGLAPEARDQAVEPGPQSLLGECLSSSQVISVPDSLAMRDRLQGLFPEETEASLVLAPLTTETRTMGVLTAASRQKGAFSKEHIGFFQSLAGQLGLAVLSATMEEDLRLDESRLEAVWQLSQMTQASLKEIADFALGEGVRLTRSSMGYLAFVNEDETLLTLHSWYKDMPGEDAPKAVPVSYSLESTGLWGDAVRQRRPVVINHAAGYRGDSRDFPEGLVMVRRHLHIPILDGGRVVAVAGVGGKQEEYDEADVRQLTLLMDGMWWQIKRKRAEEALTAERKLLIHTCMDGIVAHDKAGTIFIFNETAARILGYEPEEVIGKMNIQELYAPGEARQIEAKIHDPALGGVGLIENYETVMRHKDGCDIPIWLSAQVLHEDDRELGVIGHFRDLRERKRMEEELLRSERLAALGNMAAHISHEIKNPLMVIGGFARQILKNLGPDSQANRDKLQIIVDEVKRLEDFLVEVGGYAKISEPHLQAGDLNALIAELGQHLGPSLQEAGIQLITNLDPYLPLVEYDVGHLRQALLNIAKNSIEAMVGGGTLTIFTRRRGEEVEVELADTGPGMPAEILDKIFQPFFSTKEKGSGLGLAITQKIIEAHHGRIAIESKPGAGTRVILTLRVPREEITG
jgi:PAS domain S-box-containing protein|uniref:histidine kinase n=1 Tax=Desulfobacca acetoxidans TaxID=60893 RepID=A0A7V6A3E2_9BACT